jgi:electron transport complex protein RnfB
MVEGVATVDLNRCIGCGNCVATCQSGASRLTKKADELVPPRDKEDFLRMMSR